MKTTWLLPFPCLIVSVALAQDEAPASRADVVARLNERGLGIDPTNINDTVLDGFYELRIGAKVGYISTDGRFLLEGELYDLQDNRNLTESSRSKARVDLLSGVDHDHMIIFSPKDQPVEHTITVFTDVDCGYCRQFHREIDKVNALGIEVHYLFYPRTGPNTESWSKAEKVWCSADRNTALTNAKLGGQVPDVTCTDNPVADHYDLGQRAGVTGTPSIYTASGVHIGGYLPPDQLLETLTALGE